MGRGAPRVLLADSRPMTSPGSLTRVGASALRDLGPSWDALAASPFLTVAWLDAWYEAFGGDPVVLVLRGAGGDLLAGAALRRARGGLEAAANIHSGDWDVVAADDDARSSLWRELTALRPSGLRLEGLVGAAAETATARRCLRDAGYRLSERARAPSPRMPLPATEAELLASVSRNLRSQIGRRRRALERSGELRLRTVTGGPEIGPALDALLALEASGWKGRSGSAIVSDPATERLYRSFVAAAADTGILRLHLLELDGRLIAGDIACSHRGVGYLLKTSFDEGLSRSSPGMVLRALVLAACIEEGLAAYDFLGGDETYKMQWGPVVRPRVEIRAFTGAARLPEWAWWYGVRPTLRAGLLRAGQAGAQLRGRLDAARARRADAGTPPPEQGRGG